MKPDELHKKRKELAKLDAELINIYYMSDEEACGRYNVDYKDEAIADIEERMNVLGREIEELEEALEASDERGMYHYAFPTEESFWQWKGC